MHLKKTPRVFEMAAMLIGEEAAPCTFTHGQATGWEEKRRDVWAPQISARSHITFFVPKARTFKLGECRREAVDVAGPATQPTDAGRQQERPRAFNYYHSGEKNIIQ